MKPDELTQAERQAEIEFATRYALGELSPEDVEHFESLYATDEGFRLRYNAWAESLTQQENPQTEPPSKFLQAKARWFPVDGRGLLRKIGLLPAVIGAFAAAVLLAIATNLGWLGPTVAAPEPAILYTADDEEVAFAALDLATTTLEITVTASDLAPEPGSAWEVWSVRSDTVPVSLGVLEFSERTSQILVPQGLLEELHQSVIVITVEPEGGAGSAGPTGDVIAAGAFSTTRP